MKLVPYTNNTSTDQTIGHVTVKSGQTRQVDPRFVPASPAVNVKLQLWFVNLTDDPKYFGETTVKPNESCRVSANFFVDPNTPADSAQVAIFTELLGQSINAIESILANADLTPDELAALVELEKAGDSRKTLLAFLEKEFVGDGTPDPDDALVLMTNDDLQLAQVKAMNDGDESQLALINAEIERRTENKEDKGK